MKQNFKNRTLAKKTGAAVSNPALDKRLWDTAAQPANAAYTHLNSTPTGLSPEGVRTARDTYGENIVSQGSETSVLRRIWEAFINPFTAILLVLAVVSAFTDIILAQPGDKNPSTVLIIAAMVIISGLLRFVQETKSGNAAHRLAQMIETTTCVERQETGRQELPLDEVVVGDVIHLSAGDMIPADLRIVFAKDLFIGQSALTGESEPVEKFPAAFEGKAAITECPNLAFMGTNVISGTATGIVVATGDDTQLGQMATQLAVKPPQTSFEKGVNSVSWVLIRFMLVMVPVVLFINGFTKGDWVNAVLFAISVAVGLTPEMLPMIVTTCLAKGSVAMSKKKVVIKNLNSIQSLGSMDILCTDKTGTLTQDKIVLEYHLDIHGNEDDRVLRHAFLNSFHQTGLKNLLDLAIIERSQELATEKEAFAAAQINYNKVDEIPFDFERRRMSVVVEDKTGKTQMITKGAIEEMLRISAFVEYDGNVQPLTKTMKRLVLEKVNELNDQGMRVLGVAQKTNPSTVGAFSVADESEMVLIGYLAFLDPPKETTAAAIAALKEHGVGVKILTGDNEKVTRCICRQVGLESGRMLLGDEIDAMSDAQLKNAAQKATVLAKLSPSQKARVVTLLREGGHIVGYMGDGINDAAAMQAADVGISVDTAVDIAKESADVILLEKDLMVLEEGIIEGRKTYANMIKYIKMTASSNFGNMFSVLAASAFLPFLPMASIQLILLNLIYDISCTAIPWDNVDTSFLKRPRSWDSSSVSRFMLWLGPVSSVFDIITYLLLYFGLCPMMCGGAYHTLGAAGQSMFIALFQTGWFVQSMWSQTLVIHLLRTEKLPFIGSRASTSVTLLTALGIALLTLIPFTPLAAGLGLMPLPAIYFVGLAVILVAYMGLTTLVKNLYVKRYGELL